MSTYLALIEVLVIHADQIERFGGSAGLRDMGALESALFRPQSGYYKDVIEEAAALWESLSQNHPFVDGNKRTAFASMDTFLRINGMRLTSDADQTHEFMMNLYESGRFEFAELEAWLRKHCIERVP